jgi:hypothetical protein
VRHRGRRPRATPPRAAVDELRAHVAGLWNEVNDISAVVLLLVEGASPAARKRVREHLDNIEPEEQQ